MSKPEKDILEATKGFTMNHTMLRVKDAEASIGFYRDVLGMTEIARFDFEWGKFTLIFMGYPDPGFDKLPDNLKARAEWLFKQPGLIELTHNWGTENDPDFAHHTGNEEPRGFGHLGVCVPDVTAACARFDRLGVAYQKRPEEGAMKGLAFIKDPDGYWIEIFSAAPASQIADFVTS